MKFREWAMVEVQAGAQTTSSAAEAISEASEHASATETELSDDESAQTTSSAAEAISEASEHASATETELSEDEAAAKTSFGIALPRLDLGRIRGNAASR